MFNHNSVIYQVIIDRFDNDAGTLGNLVSQEDYNSRFPDFLGGTFEGLSNHINYVADLGVSHLQLSPFLDSDEYHGYKIKDFRTVNPRFGSDESFRRLLAKAESANLGVVMDAVFSHAANTSRRFIEEPQDGTFFLRKSMRDHSQYGPYVDTLIYKATSGNPLDFDVVNPSETLGFFGLPDYPLFNLQNPDVIEYHTQTLEKWIREYGISDVRVDSAFMQPLDSVAKIRDKIQKIAPVDFIAEYWDFIGGSDHCIGYIDGEYDIDLILQLNRFQHTPDFFSNVYARYIRMTDQLDYKRVVSIDSHDIKRFDGNYSEQRLAAIMQFCLPAIPLIFYGNETGMRLLNDGSDQIAQSRDVMQFNHPEKLHDTYRNLTRMRRDASQYPVWRNVHINDEGKLFSALVDFGNKKYAMVLNKDHNKKKIVLSELFGSNQVTSFDTVLNRALHCEKGKTTIPSSDGVLLRID